MSKPITAQPSKRQANSRTGRAPNDVIRKLEECEEVVVTLAKRKQLDGIYYYVTKTITSVELKLCANTQYLYDMSRYDE